MAPDRVVARSVRQERVGRETFAQVLHHVADIELSRAALVTQAGEKVRVRRRKPVGPMRTLDRFQRPEELGRGGDDREVRLVDATKLLWVRVHVHERLRNPGRLERRVAARGDVAKPRADYEEHVRLAQPRCQGHVVPDREHAGVRRRRVVDVVLPAE